MIPIEIKNLKSREDYKRDVRKWEPNECDCELCKGFIPSLLLC